MVASSMTSARRVSPYDPHRPVPGCLECGDDRRAARMERRHNRLPRLVFQPVPEPRRGKARIHLDVTVEDIGAGMADVVALGGAFTGERHEYTEGVVVVMTDPEGNEFCLAQYFG